MSQTSELPIGYSELRVLSCACALARREVSIKRQFFPKTAKPARGFPRNEREKKSHDSSFACHDRTRRGAPRREARTRVPA